MAKSVSVAVAPAEPRPARRRYWRWAALATIVGLLLLVALAPKIAAWAPIRNRLVRAACGDLQGSVDSRDALFRWLGDQSLDGLAIVDAEGKSAVAVEGLSTDRLLWNLIFSPKTWGEVTIDAPRIDVRIDERGLNLARVFRRSNDGRTFAEKWRGRSATFVLRDGGLTWRGPESPQSWNLDGLGLRATVTPDEEGWPQLAVEPGVLLERYELTPEMCRDLIKFAAPIVAEVTKTSGRISIHIDEVQAPLNDVGSGRARGTITFHKAEVSAGPMVQKIAALLKIDAAVRIPDESSVHVVLADGRVHHDALDFELPFFRVRLSGSVGLDETLDLTAEIRLDPRGDAPADSAGNVAEVKPGLRIPIRGTLKKPQLDALDVAKNNLSLIMQGLRKLRNRNEAPAEGGPPSGPDASDDDEKLDVGEAIDDLAPLAKEALERLRERRKKRKEQREMRKEREQQKAAEE